MFPGWNGPSASIIGWDRRLNAFRAEFNSSATDFVS